MATVTMKSLLESGVHFGHRTHKWHPAMKPYIFTERNGIHIINLQLTVRSLSTAYDLVRDTVSEGGTVLFVGTKRQAQDTIEKDATRCGMPYVTARWLGGFLTNWRTIRERISELERLERMRDQGDFDRLTKKEALNLTRQIEKLETRLGGIRNMISLPDLLFAVDVRREETAIHEANLLDIPVIGMVDTNCDPRNVDYVIPSNDDAIRAIKLVVGTIADAVLEGKATRKEEEPEMPEAEFVTATYTGEEEELTDEELLGAATLAKIKSEQEEAAEAEAAAAQAEAEAAAQAEAAAEAELEQAEEQEAEAGEAAAETVAEAKAEAVVEAEEAPEAELEPAEEPDAAEEEAESAAEEEAEEAPAAEAEVLEEAVEEVEEAEETDVEEPVDELEAEEAPAEETEVEEADQVDEAEEEAAEEAEAEAETAEEEEAPEEETAEEEDSEEE